MSEEDNIGHMKKLLVWKDTSTRVVLKSVVLGHFAMWAVRQSPYLLPEDLEKGIKEFSQSLMFGDAALIETTCAKLEKIVGDGISESDTISSWNVAKKGSGHVFVTRYTEPEPDYDFIALDAMARNIAQSVWLELRSDTK